MKNCLQCNATISDDAKFCHLCGAKIYEETTCPSCGQQLSPNDSFCHSCGAKIGAAQENVISHGVNQTHKPTSNVDSNNNSQQKLIIVIAILSIVGIAAYFILGHEDKNATSNENDNMTTDTIQWDYVCSDTIANDTATFYDVEVDDTLQIIEVLKTVKGEYVPYDSSDSTDNDPDFFSNIYEKGAILLSSGSDGRECFMEQVDDKKSKFTVCGTGDNYSYIIPNNSYKLKEYKKGKIPTFVLDNRCLIFKSKDGESLTLFKINRNGYSINWCEKEREVDINDVNYQYGYNRYDKNEGYKRSGFCDVKNGYLTFDIYDNNREVKECFDKYGNMFCDTETPDGLGFGWAYIPKLKTLVINGVFYVFDSMIPYDRNYTPKNTVSKSVQKTNYPSWIIDKWYISTPQGFYSFDIRSDKSSTVKCGERCENGTWKYVKDNPYSKVVLSQGYTLLVDEKKEIIATDRGYGLYSSNNPSRNKYANPVRQSVCSRCNGTGQMRQYAGNQVIGSTTCPACGGSGSLYR